MQMPYLCPGDHPRFQNEFWFSTKVLRFPKDQVSERANSDLANQVADPMGDRTF